MRCCKDVVRIKSRPALGPVARETHSQTGSTACRSTWCPTLAERDITWNPTKIIRRDDLVERVSDLRAQPGGYIYVYGSATMVRSLLAADLVDEWLLTIEPIILGGGKTIFAANGKSIPFTLESTVNASTGAQVCRYVRAR